ncbi:MAG: B12-binding domain-containing protein, partial [Candidatus Rokuibacteriota bacterium]
STLKRWIDAGHLKAEKTPGGHRKVAVADLLAFLRSRGRSAPSLEGLAALAIASDAAPSPEALAGLLVRGDTAVARSMVIGEFNAGQRLEEILDRLVASAMIEIGAQWARGALDVYEEHLATLRVWSILVELRGMLPVPPPSAPLALGGAPEGDPYMLPTLMAELTLADMGWRTANLGPDTPVESFLGAIEAQEPRLVWVSITSRTPRRAFFEGYPRMFDAAESRGIRIALGGQGLTPELQDRVVASAFGTRLAHLKAFARTLSG